MKLSMVFLAANLSDWKCTIHHVSDNFKFDSVRIWKPFAAGSEAPSLFLLPEPNQISEDEISCLSSTSHVAYIWVSACVAPPEGIPVLWIRESLPLLEVFDAVSKIFFRFQCWADRIYQAILHQTDLQSLCELLNDVTPNTWYTSDASFRVLSIRNDPDIPKLSYIWKYMCENHHLPMQILLKLADMGLLDEMNAHREAWIAGPDPFNFPFVSYTLRADSGIIGHLYLIGIYSNPGIYEIEILQFFGDLLTDYLKNEALLHATEGRYFENYFIDLIEKRELEDLEVHEKILDNLGWQPGNSYVVAVFRDNQHKAETEPASVNSLRIHILENTWPCRAIHYHEKTAAIFNLSQMSRGTIVSVIRKAASALHMQAGYSEVFTCESGFASFRPYYLQAEAASRITPSDIPDAVHGYTDVFTTHLCRLLTENTEADIFIHETIRTLQAYDGQNHTDLYRTLRIYLEESQNVTHAAKRLYIHRNTLLHRLHLISSLTDADLNNPSEVFRLQLSFYLQELQSPQTILT